MSLPELLQVSIKWLLWASLALSVLTLISFIFRLKQSFRLFGALAFTLLLAGSSWAFKEGYTPPIVIEGALHPPIVFDNGGDLVVAQATEDFPNESIEPTLLELAGNLSGGRKGGPVHIRLRKVSKDAAGISKPIIIGEVIRDLQLGTSALVPQATNELMPDLQLETPALVPDTTNELVPDLQLETSALVPDTTNELVPDLQPETSELVPDTTNES